jgi:hypothetical protein
MTLATPQATSETDPLVVAIVTVILTLLVGLVVGLVTALLTRKGEHAKWLREQRYEGYVAVMIDMSTFTALLETKQTLVNVTTTKARVHAYTENASTAFEAVSLLGPRTVNGAGQHWGLGCKRLCGKQDATWQKRARKRAVAVLDRRRRIPQLTERHNGTDARIQRGDTQCRSASVELKLAAQPTFYASRNRTKVGV